MSNDWSIDTESPNFTSAIPVEQQREILNHERTATIEQGYQLERTLQRLQMLNDAGRDFSKEIETATDNLKLLAETVQTIDTQIAALKPLTLVK